MKVFAIILSLCLSQIVCVFGQAKGNCSDSSIAYNCDNGCYNYSRGAPIQYGICTQTKPNPDGSYYWYCNCDFLNSCPIGDQRCQAYCKYYNLLPSCTYPSKGITCACGRKFTNDPKTYFYYQY
ncbi:hypothetical protein AVEN_22833-1 [Araneus ventricosus]|uniref:Uncharacterized protein n=1 Tax=Araneus ventricosus TaxID=182803 RepID=A0A4Y2L8K1_ARAVE|nr:hypothetical protein AVEN_22833-1 [Araneus ventricosus]